MKITADDLHQLGIADEIIREPLGGAHKDVEQQAERIKAVFEQQLADLQSLDQDALLDQRYDKFRRIGEVNEG